MPVYTLDPIADTFDSYSDAEIGYLADASDSTVAILAPMWSLMGWRSCGPWSANLTILC